MSEHISHTAICDDVRRLCLNLHDLPEAFASAWRSHTDISRLGSVTRHADRWSADVVAHVRDHPDDPDGARKLAFILGALTHRSIDRHMKPVFDYFKQSTDARIEAGRAVNECTIYCDMLVLKEVFGVEALFSPTLFDRSLSGRRAAFHELMRTTWQRVLLQMHTFKPDDDNVHEWLSRLFAGVQDFGIRLDLYDEIAANPDPEKWRRYLVDTNFYNASDPIIAAARAIQRGEQVDHDRITAAIEATGESSSLYARAMHRAIGYIRTIARLFTHEASLEQTKASLDVGISDRAMTFRPR